MTSIHVQAACDNMTECSSYVYTGQLMGGEAGCDSSYTADYLNVYYQCDGSVPIGGGERLMRVHVHHIKYQIVPNG